MNSKNAQYSSKDGVLYNKNQTALVAYPQGKTNNSFSIPSGVTTIGEEAFLAQAYLSVWGYLTSITIPNSVKTISSDAFYGANGLKDIYYTGTETQWKAITVASGNEPLTTATVHYSGTDEETKPEPTPTPVVPAAPVLSSGTGSTITLGESAEFHWNAVVNASYYTLFIQNLETGEFLHKGSSFSDTKYNFTPPAVTGVYNIWVCAVDSNGNRGPNSNTIALIVTREDNWAFVREMTQYSLANADEESKNSITNAIYNFLFKAQFRPNENTYNNIDFGRYDPEVTQKTTNNSWGAKNKGGEKASITDNGLGGTYNIVGAQGCNAYGRFASTYVYGTTGTIVKESAKGADSIKALFRKYADPGEHIRIGEGNKHSLVFLGEDKTGTGFYFTDYRDNGGTSPSIRFGYYTYANFANAYSGYQIHVQDTNKGSYSAYATSLAESVSMIRTRNKAVTRVVIKIACPIEATVKLGAETLDSRLLNSRDTLTASFGQMTRVGEAIDLELEYRDDYSFEIQGTGTGEMTLILQYYDKEKLLNERKFASVPITNETTIDVGAFDSLGAAILFVDEAGTKSAWGAGIDEIIYAPEDIYSSENQFDGANGPSTTPPTSIIYLLTHTITIPSFTGGTVTTATRFPSAGDWVVLNVTPNEGYELEKLTVTSRYGQTAFATDLGNGRWGFTMPGADVTVSATFTETNSAPTFNYQPGTGSTGSTGYMDIIYPGPSMSFTDVQPNDWFYDSVNYVYTRRLMNGVSGTAFAPQGTTTRAMIWTVLARLSGKDTTGGESWYERGQIWAMNKGITDGSAPNGDITREQLVTMLWRFKGSPYGAGALDQFSDSATVSPYASGAVSWAAANGLLKGDSGALNPQGTATRAEVAAILQRFCQNFA